MKRLDDGQLGQLTMLSDDLLSTLATEVQSLRKVISIAENIGMTMYHGEWEMDDEEFQAALKVHNAQFTEEK